MKQWGLAIGLILVFWGTCGVGAFAADVFDFIPKSTPLVIEFNPARLHQDPTIEQWLTKVLGTPDASGKPVWNGMIGNTGLDPKVDFTRIVLFASPDIFDKTGTKQAAALFECKKDLNIVFQALQKDPVAAKEANFHSLHGHPAVTAKNDTTWQMLVLNASSLLLAEQKMIDEVMQVMQKKAPAITTHDVYKELRSRPESRCGMWGGAVPSIPWQQEARDQDTTKSLGGLDFAMFGLDLAPKPELIVTVRMAAEQEVAAFRGAVDACLKMLQEWAKAAPPIQQMLAGATVNNEGRLITITLKPTPELFETARAHLLQKLLPATKAP